jgi:hypothetical protein
MDGWWSVKKAGLHNQIGIMYGTTNCSYQSYLFLLPVRISGFIMDNTAASGNISDLRALD